MKIIIPLSIAIFCFAQCKNEPKKVIDKNRNVTSLQKNDPKFLALKDTAQEHMEIFISSLRQRSNDMNYGHFIKSDFTEGDTHEHMWSGVISLSGGLFKCVFRDSAYNIHNIAPGDTVFVKQKDVEDWVIYDYLHNTRTGYFSEKYLTGQD